jgi:hypothetical protein
MKPLIFGVFCLLRCQVALDASSGTDGPPAPIPPAVITRDAATHRATIRAVRVMTPLQIDGRLDDEVYSRVEPISDFVQMEPHVGDLSTEKTDLWILFDDQYVYVTFRCWESHPERMVVNEMRRDNYRLWLGENVAFMFDTFHDRRNGVEFGVTPAGGRYEGQFTNERLYNGDWNPVWKVAVSRFANGWIAESAIPFISLRFRPGRDQTWGFQARRINAWKNELSFLTALPPELGMGRGIFSASLAPTLVGIEAPMHRSAHVEVKPYVTSDVATDRDATPSIINQASAHAGLDAKIGVNDHLSADATVRPDFAQVEADEERINLTRFNLFFPEKREFFLENAGIFTLGGQNSGDVPTLFYSRRIGLSQGQAEPIDAGGRLTGRLGDFTMGALDMQLPANSIAPATNFGVFRLKRDLLGRSSIGVIATSRSAGETNSGRNSTYGVDGTFALSPSVTVNTYWAATDTQSSPNHDISYRGQFDYIGDRYGVRLERLVVGSQFDPGLGFVPRPDMRKSAGTFRFSPRGQKGSRVRKYYLDALATYVSNNAGQAETRDVLGEFVVDFQNSDRLTLQHEYDAEFLPTPFPISTGITLPVARYLLETTRAGYSWGPQRRFAGSILLEDGHFYSGHRTAVSVGAARTNVGAQLSIKPTYSINRVRLYEGDFTTTLAGSRLTYTVTPQLFVSALVQFNSATSTVSTNARLRWEYLPGSELFIVYNDERNTLLAPTLRNRALIVKVNRLFRL